MQHNCILYIIYRPLHPNTIRKLASYALILFLLFLSGFSGLIFYLLGEAYLQKVKTPGLLFALGTLGGTIFSHLLPEYLSEHTTKAYLFLIVPGFAIWYVPSLFYKKSSSQPSLIALVAGDSLHNAFTSVLWISLCVASGRIEYTVLPAILLHEFPHKVGNFGIMIFSGLDKKKALLLSVFAALFFFSGLAIVSLGIAASGLYVIPFVIGTLLFTLVSGLLHEKQNIKEMPILFLWFFAGVFFMLFAGILTEGFH